VEQPDSESFSFVAFAFSLANSLFRCFWCCCSSRKLQRSHREYL